MIIPKHYNEIRAKIALLATNFFVETNRLESLAAVYLIEFKQWNVVWVGCMSLVLNMLMLIAQTPAGDFMDKTRHKVPITAFSIVVASVTTTAIVWTSNLYFVILIKAVEGIAATIFLPALMSLLLGVIPDDDVPKMVSLTETSNKIGSVLFTCGTGVIALYAYPDVSYVFYFLGASGLVAAICTLAIPTEKIDYWRARGSITENSLKIDPEAISKLESENRVSRYSDLLRDRNIAIFAILTFLYHLFNAAVAPLVSQIVAHQDKRTGLAFTSGVLGIAYLVQAPTAYAVGRTFERYSYKKVLLFGVLMLPIRCMICAVLAIYNPNQYALVATQVLDGLGAGIYDTLAPLIVKSLVQGTGHFGFAFGFIVTCWRLGHGLSVLIAEAILEASGGRYEVPFICLAMGGILVLFILVFGFHIPSSVTMEDEGDMEKVNKGSPKELSCDEETPRSNAEKVP